MGVSGVWFDGCLGKRLLRHEKYINRHDRPPLGSHWSMIKKIIVPFILTLSYTHGKLCHCVLNSAQFLLSGCILKVRNDGSLMPKLNHSMCISLIEDIDESKKDGQSFVFILPRGEDKLWLGGMVQPYQWDRNLTLDYPPIRRMFEKVKEFYPPLRNYGDEDVEEVLVGLRPARKGNVRLEWDPVCPSILHNYGHGGSGVTFSWGCAIEASAMVDRVLKRPQIHVSKLWIRFSSHIYIVIRHILCLRFLFFYAYLIRENQIPLIYRTVVRKKKEKK